MIEIGFEWRTDSSYLMDAWEQKWINKPPSFKPDRDIVQHRSQFRVASLINHEHRLWNEDVRNAYFTFEDTKLILQIPLSRRHIDDKLIWILTPLGQFTIKFA